MKGSIGKTLAVTAICATALIGAGAGPALAGEITGNYQPPPEGQTEPLKGKYIQVNSKSLCAFSGQNDGFHDPAMAEGEIDAATRVQSLGQIKRTLPAELRNTFNAGFECNPTNIPLK